MPLHEVPSISTPQLNIRAPTWWQVPQEEEVVDEDPEQELPDSDQVRTRKVTFV